MLIWLTDYLAQYERLFLVFHYITLRSILGALTALLISLALGPMFIRWLTQYQVGQVVREEGPQSHLNKSGTPTMGGVLILFSMTISMLLWADLSNIYVWVALLTTLGFGVIGFIDDYRKLILKDTAGLRAKWKYLFQSITGLAAAVVLYVYFKDTIPYELVIPYTKAGVIHLGGAFIILSYFVIVGSSNAVNLTDGLDGLAIMPTILVAGGLAVFAYAASNMNFANYLLIPFVPGAGEMAVFCATIVGSGLGFLWFNTYPAQVFMGDVGALALGAALGVIAIVVRQELVLFIMGGIFVIETVSVILQVGSYKLRKKRIFKMAPIHHHFELKGWAEPKVIVRFWIITFVLVLLGLASLKIR